MRVSQFFISTLKEAPSEAELVSHRLMLRAGLIKQLATGLYSWMPLGLRVLRKVERIVREEMDKGGAIELSMPAVQPAELWQESGRWDFFGPELLRFTDRHDRGYCIGPTHEEVITDIVRREIKSYRQLPVNFYQIQSKFRDEIRPRFGVMRAREFLMKDAYSFHVDKTSLEKTYQLMYDVYSKIFTRLGLKFRAVAADTGAIGGSASHEFHVLADSGEDSIAFCANSDYAANLELAEALAPSTPRPAANHALKKVATPEKTKCEDVAKFLGLPLADTVRAVAIMAENRPFPFNLLLVRGDHQLNEAKANKIPGLERFRFASDSEIEKYIGCRAGYIGPVNMKQDITIIADRSVAVMGNFVCGANEPGFHLTGVNFGRDLPEPKVVADIRNALAGDPSPDGKGKLDICRGIEVGHVFQLGAKYSTAMNATFLNQNGESKTLEMGCYGIGVSRIVAAAIEQSHDEHGIIFPLSMAPFHLAIVPIAIGKSDAVKRTAEKLYSELIDAGVEVLLDDRDERPGVMLADMELLGIPHRVVIGDRGLKNEEIEYQARDAKEAQMIPLKTATGFLKSILCTN